MQIGAIEVYCASLNQESNFGIQKESNYSCSLTEMRRRRMRRKRRSRKRRKRKRRRENNSHLSRVEHNVRLVLTWLLRKKEPSTAFVVKGLLSLKPSCYKIEKARSEI